jgi:hypothetical protein
MTLFMTKMNDNLRLRPSAMWRRTVWYIATNVLDKPLIRIYETIRSNIPEDHTLNIHRNENLNSKMAIYVVESDFDCCCLQPTPLHSSLAYRLVWEFLWYSSLVTPKTHSYKPYTKHNVTLRPIATQRPQHTRGQQYRSGVFCAVVRLEAI